MCVCTRGCACKCRHTRQSEAMEPELETVMNSLMWVLGLEQLWKGSKCSQLLSHLTSPCRFLKYIKFLHT